MKKQNNEIYNLENANKLIEEIHKVFNINNPASIEKHKGSASVIKGFLNKPEFLIREIVQNADDACEEGKGKVEISMEGNIVSIKNNGHVFTKEEFEALSSNGISSKPLKGFIGYFGIGFKSIFYYTDEVILNSGYLNCKYDSQTLCIPYKVNEKNKYFAGTNIEFKMKESTKYKDYRNEFIESLKDFHSESMIFLKNLEEIVFRYDNFYKKIKVTEKRALDENIEIVVIETTKNSKKKKGKYLLLNEKVDLKDSLKDHFIDKRLRISEELVNKYKKEYKEISLNLFIVIPLLKEKILEIYDKKEGYFFASLPTNESTGLPLHIHSDFILSLDRRELIRDDPVNKEILNTTLDAIDKVIEFYKNKKEIEVKTEIYKLIKFLEDIYTRKYEKKIKIKGCVDEFKVNFINSFIENKNFIVDKKMDYEEEYVNAYKIIEIGEILGKHESRDNLINHIKENNLGFLLDIKAKEKMPSFVEFKQYDIENILIKLKKHSFLPKDPKELYKYYCMLAELRKKYRYNWEYTKKIKSARIFLLNTNEFISIDECDGERIYYVKKKLQDTAKQIVNDINLINLDLIAYINKRRKKEEYIVDGIFDLFKDFLTLLDRHEIQEIYSNKFEKIESMSNKQIKNLFLNIIRIYEETGSSIKNIKLLVHTKNKKENLWINPTEECVYFSDYDFLGYDIRTILKFSNNIFFISENFINLFKEEIKNNSLSKETIVDFLIKNGVRERVEIHEKRVEAFPENPRISKWSPWPNSKWRSRKERNKIITEKAIVELKKYLKKNKVTIEEKFINRDNFSPFLGYESVGKYSKYLIVALNNVGYVFAVVDKILNYQEKIKNELKKMSITYIINFFKMINKNWNYYKYYTKNILVYGYRRGQPYELGIKDLGLSKFGKMLKDYHWLLDKDKNPRTPKEVFIENEITKKLAKCSLLIDEFQRIINEELIEFLDLNRNPDLTQQLNTIWSLKTRKIKDTKKQMEYVNKILWNIYKSIEQSNDKEKSKIKEEFEKNNIPILHENKIKLVNMDNILWSSKIPIRYLQNTICKSYYFLSKSGYEPKLEDFFIEILKIKEEFSSKQLMDYYKDLTDKHSISKDERDLILYLYEEANEYRILKELVNNYKLLNMNDEFTPDIKYISLNPDVNSYMKWSFKDEAIAVSDRMYQKGIDGISRQSLYSYCLNKKTLRLLSLPLLKKNIEKVGKVKDMEIDWNKHIFVNSIWTYFNKKYGNNDKKLNQISELCNYILNFQVKYVDSVYIQYFIEDEQLTERVEKKHILTDEELYTTEDDTNKMKSHIFLEITNRNFYNDAEWTSITKTFFDRNEYFVKEILLSEYNIDELLGYKLKIKKKLKEKPTKVEPKEEIIEEEEIKIKKKQEEKEPELKETEPLEENLIEKEPTYKEPIEEKLRRPKEKLVEQREINKELSNWVKSLYKYHCQICLSTKKPEQLSYSESYTGKLINRKAIIEAHHIKEIRDGGHDHSGNLLALCKYHHKIIHNINFEIEMIEKCINNIKDIQIEWPSGKTYNWKILKISKDIKFAITPKHLEKIRKYIEIINQNKNCEKK